MSLGVNGRRHLANSTLVLPTRREKEEGGTQEKQHTCGTRRKRGKQRTVRVRNIGGEMTKGNGSSKLRY